MRTHRAHRQRRQTAPHHAGLLLGTKLLLYLPLDLIPQPSILPARYVEEVAETMVRVVGGWKRRRAERLVAAGAGGSDAYLVFVEGA